MPLFVLGRAVQGLGAGALGAIVYVTVGRAFSEEERPRQFAILSTAWVIPGLIAPGVGGLVAQHLGWRFVFLGLAVLPLVAAAVVWPPLRRLGVAPAAGAGAGAEASLPVRAALVLAIGAGAIVEGLGNSSVAVGLPLVLVGLAIGLPALRRLTPPGTLRAARGMPAAIATRGLATFAFFGTDAFLAFALADLRHVSAVGVGLALTPTTITWTIGAWIQARTAHRYTRRATASVGIVLLVLGAAATGAAVLTSGVPVWVVALVWGIGGLGMGLSYSPTGLVVLSAGRDRLGRLGDRVGAAHRRARHRVGHRHRRGDRRRRRERRMDPFECAHDRVRRDGRGRLGGLDHRAPLPTRPRRNRADRVRPGRDRTTRPGTSTIRAPMTARAFPDGFLWGTATAAHQVEGGNWNSDWWAWEHAPARDALRGGLGRRVRPPLALTPPTSTCCASSGSARTASRSNGRGSSPRRASSHGPRSTTTAG